VCCSVLQCVSMSALHECVAVCRSVLQCVAVCEHECVAVCCSVLQCVRMSSRSQRKTITARSVLQCVAVCCSVTIKTFLTFSSQSDSKTLCFAQNMFCISCTLIQSFEKFSNVSSIIQ